MTLSSLIDQISEGQGGKSLLPKLAQLALEIEGKSEFAKKSLGELLPVVNASNAALIQGTKGQWRVLGSVHDVGSLPTEMLAEALDQQLLQSNETTSIIPVGQRGDELLLLSESKGSSQSEIQSYAAAFGFALYLNRHLRHQAHLHRRSTALLDMTKAWSQSRETDQLLQAMAETSTALLDAERATIFLWNQQTNELIGKPALGVESGELRIADTAGLVGQVVRSGKPHRVDHDVESEQAQIDRAVDTKLDFVTRSLLCVPLFDEAEKIIGAFEIINKQEGNFSDEDEETLVELAHYASVAIDNTQYVEQIDSTRKQVAAEAAGKIQLIGGCPEMVKIEETINRLAQTDLAVLILGENGTGKEIVAQMIHFESQRRNNVLVAVNCAAIAESLLESELFGHEQGAFTDARETRQGKFELADKGTLFLDEIGDMSPGGQAKLLRVLEDKVVVRIGGSVSIPTDVRVIAATNQDLEQAVKEKEFRQDLFFRLNVVTIQLPPLRDRGEDVILLAEHFLNEFSAKARRKIPQITAAARKRLMGHHWPGNVRELRNMMERLSYLHVGDRIEVEDLPFTTSGSVDHEGIPMDLPLTEATRHFQCEYIEQHIKRSGGNMTDAAQRLGLHRSNLYRKMKQLGMEPSGSESDPE